MSGMTQHEIAQAKMVERLNNEVTRLTEELTLADGDGEALRALRAENARLREVLTKIGQLLSYAGQDAVSPAVAQANLNAAWHEARAALAGEQEPT